MNLKRIYIFGGTASGKTTLAKILSKKLKIPLFSTDSFVYKKRWTKKFPEKEKIAKLERISRRKKWIIEGVHTGNWIIPALKKANLVIFLNINRTTLFKRFLKRKTNKGKRSFTGLSKVLFWIMFYNSKYYKSHKNLVEKNKGKYITLKNQKEVDKFIENLRWQK